MPSAYLIVDDDPDVLKAAASALAREVERVDTETSPQGLADRATLYDAVLLDMNFAAGARDGSEGLDELDRLLAADPALSVVLMTTYGGVALMRAAARLTVERRASGAALNLDDLERRAIVRALSLYDGNVSHAAAALGLTRPALYRRMERHGL